MCFLHFVYYVCVLNVLMLTLLTVIRVLMLPKSGSFVCIWKLMYYIGNFELISHYN
jgi:hypothetical protein